MKNTKHILLNIFSIFIVSVSGVAFADYKSEIINSCSEYQTGKDNRKVNACKLYIDGFIDAALLSEQGKVSAAATNKENTVMSNYLERAYRTRLLTTSSMIKDEDAHQFCIPNEYDRKLIASSLAKSIDISLLDSKSLKEVLFGTLIENFPCSK